MLKIVLLLFVFFLGRMSAKIEHRITFQSQLILLMEAVMKVDSLLSLKGMSIKDLKQDEFMRKVREQIELDSIKR